MEYNGYNIVGDGSFGLRVIKSIGPGALPDKLRGKYTNSFQAEKAITSYLREKERVEAEKEAKEDAKPTPIKYKKPKKE